MNQALREALEMQFVAVQAMMEPPRQNACLVSCRDDIDSGEVWEQGLCQLSLLVMI